MAFVPRMISLFYIPQVFEHLSSTFGLRNGKSAANLWYRDLSWPAYLSMGSFLSRWPLEHLTWCITSKTFVLTFLLLDVSQSSKRKSAKMPVECSHLKQKHQNSTTQYPSATAKDIYETYNWWYHIDPTKSKKSNDSNVWSLRFLTCTQHIGLGMAQHSDQSSSNTIFKNSLKRPYFLERTLLDRYIYICIYIYPSNQALKIFKYKQGWDGGFC